MSEMPVPPFRKLLKKWLSSCYDYLGLILLLSLITFGLTLAGLALLNSLARMSLVLGLASAIAFYIFVFAPLTTSVSYSAHKIVTRDDPSPADLLHGFRQFFAPAARLGFAQSVLYVLLSANVWFYLSRPSIGLKTLGILFLYLFVVWLVSTVYHNPILVEQNPGALKVIKRGFLLVLDNVAFTFALFSVIILLALFSAVSVLGLPLLWFGMLSVLQAIGLRALLVKYGVVEPEPEPAPDLTEDNWSLDDIDSRAEEAKQDSPESL